MPSPPSLCCAHLLLVCVLSTVKCCQFAKDVVLLKSAALGGPPTKWTTCSCACPSVAPFFRTGRTLYDCSSFLARGKCTWRRRTVLQEVCENCMKKKKKNRPGWLWARERVCLGLEVCFSSICWLPNCHFVAVCYGIESFYRNCNSAGE